MKPIENKKQASKFLSIPESEIFYFHKYLDGEWEYYDINYNYHLYKKINSQWIELTEGVKAIDGSFYLNGGWEYRNEDGYWYLFDENNELVKKYRSWE